MDEEVIKLFKPDSPNQKSTQLFFQSPEEIVSPVTGLSWGLYTKQILRGEFRRKNNREIWLVRKEVYFAKEYYGKWRKLKQLGIPTIDSMRVTKDDMYVLMTDLSRSGAKSYGKVRYFDWDEMHQSQNIDKSMNILDSQFFQIPLEEIKREVERIEMMANKNGVLLPIDDPFDLFLFPDGSWKILVLDLSAIKFADRGNTPEIIKENNSICVYNFLYMVRYMQNRLDEPKSSVTG